MSNIKEGVLIGLKAKNKRKECCLNGHILPQRKMVNGKWRRDCRVCIADRRRKNKDSLKESQRHQLIRDSKFPLITYLEGLKK